MLLNNDSEAQKELVFQPFLCFFFKTSQQSCVQVYGFVECSATRKSARLTT